jgi:hypothetical protein
MKALLIRHKNYWKNSAFVESVVVATLLLACSFIVNFYAGIYATEKASNPVTDLILDHLPVFNVGYIFIYGPVVLWAYVCFLCFREPKRIPFVLQSTALFILIRSVFITLTHMGPFPSQAMIDYSSDVIHNFTFGGDLFFSAHTGLPFLMALLFWNEGVVLRKIFIATAIFFGAIVLMAHVHYSIDVLSAFFITYSIFHLAQFFFPRGWKLFNDGL